MLIKRLHMGGEITSRQYAAMHFGVQCFNTSIQHFWKTGVIGHLGNFQTMIS